MINLTKKLRDLIQGHNIEFKELEHGPGQTCESAAAERGEELKIGGKTLLLKDKRGFNLFVLSAAKKADNNKIRKILKSQKLRFATKEELMELIGVEKGALPPFGRDLLPFDLYLDKSILDNDKIAFNAGVLTTSFILKVEDYLKLVDPIICQFSKEE
ncbi:MAG: hypothetical protein DRQ88_03020 [Epsilonproteobacteria bacterium]|nr:MAG: hypothetical protein DRQ89_01975 [Campylobacterota bacterium]RLA67444.1 MAG: hypothetical protein DRQ88_03020 [Campylobacterota bacterium]